MKLTDALKILNDLDQQGVYIFSRGDIEKMFPSEQEKTLEKSLQRLVRGGVLERVGKGLYLNPLAVSKKSRVVEDIAAIARRGYYSYLSLESILSEYGALSQIPLSYLTVMTTGAKGLLKTRYGVIEFTHTQRPIHEIVKKTVLAPGRPLRIATLEAAKQDLRRVGRNVSLLEENGGEDAYF
jgi:predicted transcriptional regulator of viral defense system